MDEGPDHYGSAAAAGGPGLSKEGVRMQRWKLASEQCYFVDSVSSFCLGFA